MKAAAVFLFFLLIAGQACPADLTTKVGAQPMRVDVLRARTPKPLGLALLLHTSGGIEQADFDYADRLVGAGFTVAVPYFLAAYGITPQRRQEAWTRYRDAIYGDLKAAIATVARAEGLDPARSVAVGFSNGGHWATCLAARGDVRKAVSYYGAYSEAGADKALSTFTGLLSARSAPVLAFHGTDDDVVPVAAAQRLQAIAAAAGAPLTMLYFDKAGHRFERSGETRGPEAEATTAAWQGTVEFLTK